MKQTYSLTIKSNQIFLQHRFLPDYLRNLEPVSFGHALENQMKYFGRKYLKMNLEQQKDNIQIFSHDTYK